MKSSFLSFHKGVRWPAAVVAAAAVAALAFIVQSRVTVQSDVVAGLPAKDPAVADASYVIRQHGVLDTVFLELSLAEGQADPNVLVAAAERLRSELLQSGLFNSVGSREFGAGLPRLLGLVADHLPLLFTEGELREQAADRLRPERVREALREDFELLSKLESIGQAELVARDPLGLRNIILAKMSLLLPTTEARIFQGNVLSADERHLLLPAQPKSLSTDVAFAHKLAAAIDGASASLVRDPDFKDKGLKVISVGAFRATLDNESYSRGDARRAALISLVGIALLLLLCFPRPLLGLLCLVPALAGTALSLLVLSISQRSISILALGFGGALIGLAVDQGIAYLIFLDRERETTGWEASRSVLVVSLAATSTTVGSFLALQFSGFPLLKQLGLFAGLGVFFAFLFVHLVFPLIFSSMPPAPRPRFFRLSSLTSSMALGGGWTAAGLALVLFLVLLGFAKPRFQGDLKALNTVSPQTVREQDAVLRTWGDVMRNVYLLVEGGSPSELQGRSDKLGAFFQGQIAGRKLSGAFTSSMVLPGQEAAAGHLAAWKDFWTPARIEALRLDLGRLQSEFGFSKKAFAPFFQSLDNPASAAPPIPEEIYPLFGISRSRDGEQWMALNPVVAGPAFDRDAFFREAKTLPGVRVLDYDLFADRLSRMLVSGFTRMLLICVGGLAVVLLLLFWELTIPAVVLGHTVFALVCTLGTMKLLGQPLNIPGLALAIIVPGMGSDFALFFARSKQRFHDEREPAMAIFRNAVFLSAAAAMIGFGGLAAGHHVLLRSIGVTGLLAIGYSALGAFLLLPPVLRRVLAERPWPPPLSSPSPVRLRWRVMRRFRHLEIYPRMFARFKMLSDPMFPKIAEFVPHKGEVLHIGCGFGVPSAWLMARFPQLRVCGLDPDAKRVRVARHVFGARGTAAVGPAPLLPSEPARADAALMLDMVHFLSDAELSDTLAGLSRRLVPSGSLVMRATLSWAGKRSWLTRFEDVRMRLLKKQVRYRSAEELRTALTSAGFDVDRVEASMRGGEVTWITASRR